MKLRTRKTRAARSQTKLFREIESHIEKKRSHLKLFKAGATMIPGFYLGNKKIGKELGDRS